jgi:hypothetical protein
VHRAEDAMVGRRKPVQRIFVGKPHGDILTRMPGHGCHHDLSIITSQRVQ